MHVVLISGLCGDSFCDLNNELLTSVPRNGSNWDETFDSLLYSAKCTVKKFHANELTPELFFQEYEGKKPVIIIGATDSSEFRHLVSKFEILDRFGKDEIVLATSNKKSYAKSKATVAQYIQTMMDPLKLNASGVGTMYHFGDNQTQWSPLFLHYKKPTQYFSLKTQSSLAFGMGGSGSGVPFHTHGPVFAEVFYGMKRWFLKEARTPEPIFDPDGSSLSWFMQTYRLSPEPDILDCVVLPGEFLYIPSLWHHATLNIGQTVFMSIFT